MICARDPDQLAEATDQMRAKGHSAEHISLDVTDLDATRAAIADQRYDIMVNFAGVARHSAALDTQAADFEAVIAVNIRAAYFLATEAARGMVGRGGSIIQVSSQMAHVGRVDRAVYYASKHAVKGMTKSMAIEWGPHNIRVNTICPTFIRTPLTEPIFSDQKKWLG